MNWGSGSPVQTFCALASLSLFLPAQRSLSSRRGDFGSRVEMPSVRLFFFSPPRLSRYFCRSSSFISEYYFSNMMEVSHNRDSGMEKPLSASHPFSFFQYCRLGSGPDNRASVANCTSFRSDPISPVNRRESPFSAFYCSWELQNTSYFMPPREAPPTYSRPLPAFSRSPPPSSFYFPSFPPPV